MRYELSLTGGTFAPAVEDFDRKLLLLLDMMRSRGAGRGRRDAQDLGRDGAGAPDGGAMELRDREEDTIFDMVEGGEK